MPEPTVKVANSEFARHLEKFQFTDSRACDVIFRFAEKQHDVLAHRVVLCSASTCFRHVFGVEPNANHQSPGFDNVFDDVTDIHETPVIFTVKEEVDVRVFEAAVHFAYNGTNQVPAYSCN